MIHRRTFLTGLAALVAAPAVVRASSIMPVSSRALIAPDLVRVIPIMRVVGMDVSVGPDLTYVTTMRLRPDDVWGMDEISMIHPVEGLSAPRMRLPYTGIDLLLNGSRDQSVVDKEITIRSEDPVVAAILGVGDRVQIHEER